MNNWAENKKREIDIKKSHNNCYEARRKKKKKPKRNQVT